VPPGPATVDVRLSGTTARFLAPLLALGRAATSSTPPHRSAPARWARCSTRSRLGAGVTPLGAPGHLPVAIEARGVRGGRVEVAGDVSSQFLSGLLLAGPAAPDGLTVELTTELVSEPYVELTLDTMRAFGATGWTARPRGRSSSSPAGTGPAPTRSNPTRARRRTCWPRRRSPADASASRAWGARQGDARFADVLASMGAEVHRDATGTEVRGTGQLRGIDVDLGDLSDTAQTLAAVAVFADGPTRVRGIGFIRRKETDRIAAVVTELRRLGIHAEEEPDGFVSTRARPAPAGSAPTTTIAWR
jgi:3-phosphoshikimate 1-carboxyvinyltransferase